MGGGIMNLSKEGIGGGIIKGVDMGSRAGFFNPVKAVKSAVKGVAKTVGKIAKSPIGKAALLTAGGAYALGLGPFGGAGALSGIRGAGFARGLLPSTVDYTTPLRGFFSDVGKKITSSGIGKSLTSSGGGITKLATLGLVSKFLTDTLGMPQEQAEAELARDPSGYLEQYYRNLNPPGNKDPETYEAEVAAFVTANTSEYAVGGRVGFADGPVLPPDPTQPVNPFGPKPGDFGIEENIPIKMASNIENDKILEALYEKYIDLGFSPKEAADKAMEEFDRMSMMKTEGRGLAAIGGRMMKAVGDSASMNAMQAAGIEGLPIRQNKAGVKELDLRETGGFIPPVGIKEKEDDIPAMLSNNEFVMTADAVRGMGDGNVELGAQRMYDQMKMLEAGGKV